MRLHQALVSLGAAIALLALVGCAGTGPQFDMAPPRSEVGVATFYSSRFDGRETASGRRYDEDELTAAHRTLAFGTRVRVTNLANQRSVIVVITDRGPFGTGRVIDVSRRAARELGMLRAGTARVRLEPLPG
jgi:rare lipoprotein A